MREAFDTLFITPIASHCWGSCRSRSHWVDLEGWQDSIAGPISAISNCGDCEYVYSRNDWYFAQVNDPTSLLIRLMEWHSGLATGVENFIPVTPDEAADKDFMRSLVCRMQELVEQACAVEQARWQAAK